MVSGRRGKPVKFQGRRGGVWGKIGFEWHYVLSSALLRCVEKRWDAKKKWNGRKKRDDRKNNV